MRRGLTQEELAARVGRHVTTISNLEGDRFSSRSTVEAVARELKTTPEALGFRFRRPLKPSDLTAEQRDLLDELLALPPDEYAAVRDVLAKLRERKERKK